MNKFYQVPVWFNVEAKDELAAEREVLDYLDSRIGGTSSREFAVGDAVEIDPDCPPGSYDDFGI